MARTYYDAYSILFPIRDAVKHLGIFDDTLTQQIFDFEQLTRDISGETGLMAILGMDPNVHKGKELREEYRSMIHQDLPPKLDAALAALEARYLTLKA